jgi:hypothetical protein
MRLKLILQARRVVVVVLKASSRRYLHLANIVVFSPPCLSICHWVGIDQVAPFNFTSHQC